MAQRLEVYHGGDGGQDGRPQKGFKNIRKQNKKGAVTLVKGSSSKGTIQVVQVVKKKPKRARMAKAGGKRKPNRDVRSNIVPQLWW